MPKLCLIPHEPLQQPKMQAVSCSACIAIGGKPTAKKGKKCKVCGIINHLNCRTCKHFPLSVAIFLRCAGQWVMVVRLVVVKCEF